MYQNESSHGDIKENMDLVEARNEYKTTNKDDPRITKIGKISKKI